MSKKKEITVKINQLIPGTPDVTKTQYTTLQEGSSQVVAVEVIGGSKLLIDPDGLSLVDPTGQEVIPVTDFVKKRIVVQNGTSLIRVKRT